VDHDFLNADTRSDKDFYRCVIFLRVKRLDQLGKPD
jgi:hypothetical protein